MGAHSLRQKIFLSTAFVSPWSTMLLAIWMTWSCSASGKMPGRPAHSMSKLRMRIGAMPHHSSSFGECETTSLNQTSTSSCEWVHGFCALPCESFHGRGRHAPAGSVSQFMPTMLRSTM